MFSSAIDHLVVTAPTLTAGIQFVEQQLGCRMQPGGRHPRMGTHNALLRIGVNCYLEVISIDPDAVAPARSRWFELDRLLPDARPRLATWVMRTNDIFKVANTTGAALGAVEEMSRGALKWQITIPPDGQLPFSGLAPAVIQWKGDDHPASKLADSSVSLLQLTGHHPDAGSIRDLLHAVHFEGPYMIFESTAEIPIGLEATFQTSNGLIVLSE
ncbi:MAG: VOC family protein [Planctomycetaceae bacterium]